jgi:hypothetical protein
MPATYMDSILKSPVRQRPGAIYQYHTPTTPTKPKPRGPAHYNNLNKATNKLLEKPVRNPRFISKTPWKVLDAPDLQVNHTLLHLCRALITGTSDAWFEGVCNQQQLPLLY